MVDYENEGLKPGIHLFQGEHHLKTIDHASFFGSGIDFHNIGGVISESVWEQFARAAWVRAAIVTRQDYMSQIHTEWDGVGDEIVAGISLMDLPRIDTALQLFGWAFFHKERLENGRVINHRWLNPDFMIPQSDTAFPGGFHLYNYSTSEIIKDAGAMIPDHDLLIIRQDGVREAYPMSSAQVAASLSSQIVIGIAETMDSFYDTNALPVVAVIVPPETPQTSVEAAANRFREIFQFRRPLSGNKTIGLSGDVKIETISFSPDDLQMGELSDMQINAILASHQVSPALINRDVNRAELEFRQIEMVIRMGARLKLIEHIINNDTDWNSVGNPHLTHNIKKHELMQTQNLATAQSLQMLTGGQPIMTVDEARETLELEPMPETMIPEQSDHETAVRSFEMAVVNDETAKARRYYKKNGAKARPFTSSVLTSHALEHIKSEATGDSPDYFRSY